MKKIIFLIWCIILLFTSCSTIKKYSSIPIKRDLDYEFVTRVPADIVNIYDSSLVDSWYRTFNRCVQIKNNIDKEIDEREIKIIKSGRVFSGVSAVLSIGTAIYSLAFLNPSTVAIGIVGILMGTTATTSLAFLKQDERINVLREKSNKLEQLKEICEEELAILEMLIAKKNLLVYSGKTDILEETPPDSEVMEKYQEIEVQIIELRRALTKWDNEAK